MEGLGFVFEKWLDIDQFTNHSAPDFRYKTRAGVDLTLIQGEFCHTKKKDHTGAVVWDDAVVLARYLEKLEMENPGMFKGKRVAELGCGCGLTGIVLSTLGAEVVLTDRSEMMPLVAENIKRNLPGANCYGAVHEWGSERNTFPELLRRPFDVIIASGCVYHEEAIEPLNRTISEMAKEETKIYFAIDFRFDIRDNRESDFVAPVVRKFLEQTKMRMSPIEDTKLDQNFIKRSVLLYECTV